MVLGDPGIEVAHVASAVELPAQCVIIGNRWHPWVKMRQARAKVNRISRFPDLVIW